MAMRGAGRLSMPRVRERRTSRRAITVAPGHHERDRLSSVCIRSHGRIHRLVGLRRWVPGLLAQLLGGSPPRHSGPA
jgi:hypothetical protein